MFVMFSCLFVIFPYGVRGNVLDWVVSIQDLCLLFFFVAKIPDFVAINECIYIKRYALTENCNIDMISYFN